MNGYNFTDHVRHSLAYAREEAVRLHHEYVGTEHLLLGLLRVEGVGMRVLTEADVDPDAVRAIVEDTVKTGRAMQPTGLDLPYTSRAKKVLELSMSEARAFNHSYVGTEHLLLGLLAEEKGIAAHVLMEVGLTLETARQQVAQLLGAAAPQSGERLPRRPRAPGPRQSCSHCIIETARRR
jgi:ATP-dependent Clp protease ATP-binding subunit ClpC